MLGAVVDEGPLQDLVCRDCGVDGQENPQALNPSPRPSRHGFDHGGFSAHGEGRTVNTGRHSMAVLLAQVVKCPRGEPAEHDWLQLAMLGPESRSCQLPQHLRQLVGRSA